MVVALPMAPRFRSGCYEGDTENITVVTGLLADLLEPGLMPARGLLLFVLDGAESLTKGCARRSVTRH